MQKVAINIVRFNQDLALLEKCIGAALNQSLDDYSVTLTENGSNDSIESAIVTRFGTNPKFRFVNNEKNLGFAGANNRFFRNANSEFVMPLNPDTVMPPDYLKTLLAVFIDPSVAAAEGKMLKPDPLPDNSWLLDGTGMTISRARRARERGQLEVDRGQYDAAQDVFGVSATAAAYRMSSLEKVKLGQSEYFDEDFFTYWEDLDLSWRLRLAGFRCSYVPHAVIYHSRFAGQSKHGFLKPAEFTRHIKSLPSRVVYWDWRNHLFSIIKNDFGWSFVRDLPFIATRELLLFGYLLIIEPKLVAGLPDFVRLLPRILKKRKLIQKCRVATSSEMQRWFDER
ncbi:glycosyltransferase family 2 protein [Tunturibacter psychrotolerans]|uniref:Glycosyltransferase family 2 protein n=1 Tax=Tunturiibacter psychrotolerans TaxID=3069686 RepID=A0AAU7ZTJ7_9BACT